jgi:hypothetical protein
VSPAVHALPSSQAFPLFVLMQSPLTGSQLSDVQALLSLQSLEAPPWHAPPTQTSFAVHAFPSLHGSALLVCTQPSAGSHESVVQGFPSSQLRGAPTEQLPASHVPLPVHASPSLHVEPSTRAK